MAKSLIEELRAKYDAATDTIETTVTTAVTEERELTEAETANVEAQTATADQLRARIDQLVDIEERRAASAELGRKFGTGESKVTRVEEAELYREDNANDFIRDALSAEIGRDSEAAGRLAAWNEEQRASTSTKDLVGYVIPQYALDAAALAVSEGRPTANIFVSRPLTSNVVHIPVQVGKTSVAAQGGASVDNYEGGAGASSKFTSTELIVPARTIIGDTSATVQALDFGSVDQSLILSDLQRDYAEKLNAQILSGNGVDENEGIFTSPAVISGAIDGTSANEVGEIWAKVTQAKVAVRNATKAAATHVVLTPDHFGFIEGALDENSRPLYGFQFSHGQNVQGEGLTWHGLTVVQDSELPDGTILVCKASEGLLWESATKTLTLDQTSAKTGEVEFVLRGYSQFTARRRPGAFVQIDNLPAPTFA